MKRFVLVTIAVLAVACRDQNVLQPPAVSGPAALIMDGAHGGPNGDFFFLAPLVPDPSGSANFEAGKFNAGLAPAVEICELTGDPRLSDAAACAGGTQPVLVFGPATMTLDATNQQYRLNWDAKASSLDLRKFYRLSVRGAPHAAVLGFLDLDPVDQGVKNIRTGDVVPFQDGRSLPIKVRIEQGAFGATNPDHVEQVVPNRFTTTFVDVTTNTGFAGARFLDNWLPAAAVAAGIDRVVVIIERVPVNNAVPATSCLESGFKELEGCYRFRTDPDLHPYGPFNATVIAGVCFEQPILSNAPYEMFRREEAGEQELVRLEDIDAPFLNCATFSPTPPPSVGVSPGARSGRLLGLASAGLRALVGRIGRALAPRSLHAVDLGAGGRTNAFSLFGWARRATLTKAAATDNQVTLIGTKVLTDPTVCLTTLHPATRPLVGEPVTFTVAAGGGTVGGGASVPRVTGSDGCASAPWVLGSATALAGNRVTAAAAASPGTVEFVATGVSVAVDAASVHSCALNASGQASCWGLNFNGQLGDGTTTPRLVPTAVTGGPRLAALSPGFVYTCGLTTTGAAYCWGFNANGQLGDGTTTQRLEPTPVAEGLTFTALSAGGGHTCGLTPTGAAYCWGFNGSGQLGDGTTTQRLAPTAVAGNLRFSALGAGSGSHTCGVTIAGAGYCWGRNIEGQLGDGTTTDRLVPTPVVGGLTLAGVRVGGLHTCGVTRTGAAYCWGQNVSGQLGDGTTTDRLVPAAVVFTGNGAGVVRLTNSPGFDGEPDWSPDGTKIAFQSERDGGDDEIYVMNADGTGVVRLTNNPGVDATPVWSPDGTKIAFRSTRAGADREIFVMNADGTGVVQLTTGGPGLDGEPAWSPDGTKIAFASVRAGLDFEIYVMNADGTGVVRLTNSPGADLNPAWSPDGAKIAFDSQRDGNDEIYVMNTDGTGVVRLTANAGVDTRPAWSPDGAKIAFDAQRGGADFAIYVMNADGTGVLRLTTSSGVDFSPAWSRDGTRIAFASTRDDPGGDIYVMNVAGAGPAAVAAHLTP
jgi:Tol biopolymer transport system component